MLTALHLGNFKAFANTQRLPIKPLTLIFGANSSGKSSLIHGLLLARHLWERGATDAHKLRQGSDSVDLGGVHQFVHRGNIAQQVCLMLDLSAPSESNGFQLLRSAAPSGNLSVSLNIKSEASSLASTTDLRKGVFLSVEVTSNGRVFARIRESGEGTLVWDLVSWEFLASLNAELKSFEGVLNDLSAEHASEPRERFEEWKAQLLKTLKNQPISVGASIFDPVASRYDREIRRRAWDEETIAMLLENPKRLSYLLDLEDFLEELSECFREELIYLGPLRWYPPRHFAEPEEDDPNWHSGGGKAWECIREDEQVRSHANELLARIQIPYRISLREWVARDAPEATLRELVLIDTHGQILSQRDVGTGVSQVIPVIAIAAGAEKSLIAIEQPEIHLHPALQAELGDVFIQSALGEQKNMFLLETHSEHLILRILRRVRETAEGKLASGMTPVRPDDIAVVFVEPTSKGSVVRDLPVTPDGDFGAPWPGGFFAERFKDLP